MVKLRKKNSLLVTIICVFILLTGCWDRVETNDLAIVTATGIDQTDDGQVELSLQIFIPKSMSAGQGGSPGSAGKETMVMSHKGKNVADALSKLQAELSRDVFWGICKVFIFGENTAKAGLHDHLDFLLRHPEPRERAFIFVSEGKAKKYLELTADLERYSAEYIREIANMGHGMGVTLQGLDEMLSSEDQGAALPYLEEAKGASKKFMKIAGTALFHNDRMVGTISESTTRGLLWLRNEVKDYTVTLKLDDEGEVAIFPVKTRINLNPKIQGGEWKMLIKVKAEGSMIQNSTHLNVNNAAALKKVEKAFRQRIKQRMGDAIKESQEMQVDVINFGKEFHRKYPQEWKQVKDSWEQKFPEVKPEFIIDANIRREGFVSEPVKERER
ncbi:Ger(x)C family spore germination protein [Siminovitchia acidinfaciens]|uniref:Ger(X)C family spore germination protein n=1 Tax=Siminovitchia acidinfaciens TaxID=2321395 RepID=A0A429XZX4_9BACI|nr:Ger(x)C family spore germination protein [Siminovitchia acidinfaciens]RST74336.1 Ger(x)C family spore germination protein [Siminovitchia acidinfaciens]